MGLQTVPAYMAQTGFNHPAELDRNLLEGIFGRSGMLRYGDFAVTAVGGSLQINVAAGRACLVGSESAQQGAYFVWSDAAENLAVPAPAGSTRHDSLILRVVDPQYGASGTSRAEWEVVAGVAGAGAARPDSDFNSGGSQYKAGAWFRVANLVVNPGDTQLTSGDITDLRQWVRTGGKSIALSTALPTDAAVGDEVYAVDTDTWLHRRASGSWWETGTRGDYQDTTQSIASSTTPQNSQMSLPVMANAIYAVTVVAFYDGGTGGDFKCDLDVPAGSTKTWNPAGIDTGETTLGSGEFPLYVPTTPNNSAVGALGTGTVLTNINRGTLRIGGTAGTATVTFGQVTSNATSSRIIADSHFTLTRIG